MLTGKTALVTGSTSGIGAATAQALAVAGCNVMLNGFGDPAAIDALQGGIAAAAPDARLAYHPADLARPDQIAALVEAAQREFGAVDVLVNNAVKRYSAPVEAIPVEHWDLALAVNLSAPFHLIRLILPEMRRRGWGRIVNMASGWGLTGTVNRADYVATKHAIVGLTRAVALETVRDGITCNAICPGATLTPHAERQIETRMQGGLGRDAAIAAVLAERQPSGRYVTAEQVAQLILFLCGDAAQEMTGSPISIDGGWVAM